MATMEKDNKNDMFKGRTILITGGTGSFGNSVVERLLQMDVREIRVFSRDEKKQADLMLSVNDPRLKCYLGDVRDAASLGDAVSGVDYLFHAAALKQVPSCEAHPMEAVKTNVLGTENVLNEAINAGVKKVVCLSTDKAVHPINAMGMSKALMEKVMIAKSRQTHNNQTIVCGTRYGNVMGSRGSVIPLFLDQIRRDIPLTLTEPNMTRYMMSLDEAVNLVFFAFNNCRNGDIFVQKSPACSIQILAKSLTTLCGKPSHPLNIIGARHGEKLVETLLTHEELVASEDLLQYYRIKLDKRDVSYPRYTYQGQPKVRDFGAYTSRNTQQLDQAQMSNLLRQMPMVQELIPPNLITSSPAELS